MTTIAAVLRGATDATRRRDLEVLLGAALEVGRAHLYAHGEALLSGEHARRFEAMLRDYYDGMPVAYVIGRREFCGIELDVSPAVLIPRPETELLVETTVQRLPRGARVADLGTGSGAIALAIKRRRPDCSVVATDVSPDAVSIARGNAQRHCLDVEFRVGDWYAALNETVDAIVSNPPYVAAGDSHLDDLVGEPRLALVGGDDGLQAIRRIVENAPRHLTRDGWLLIEHGYDQGAAVRALFEAARFASIETQRDFGGNERVTLGRR